MPFITWHLANTLVSINSITKSEDAELWHYKIYLNQKYAYSNSDIPITEWITEEKKRKNEWKRSLREKREK